MSDLKCVRIDHRPDVPSRWWCRWCPIWGVYELTISRMSPCPSRWWCIRWYPIWGVYESTFAEASTCLIPSAFYILLVPVLLWQHPSRLLSLIIPSKVNLSMSFTSHNHRWVVAHYSYHPTFILPPRSILFNLCRLIYRGHCRIAPAPPPLSHLSMLSHAISRSQGPCPAPRPPSRFHFILYFGSLFAYSLSENTASQTSHQRSLSFSLHHHQKKKKYL